MDESLSLNDVNELMAALLQRRKRVIEMKESLEREELCELTPSGTGEVVSIHTHPADLASDVQERQTLGEVVRNQVKELQEIEGALRRINFSSYGKCEDCGEVIPLNRLRVVPEARFCFSCEREHESRTKDGARSLAR
jgi:RNA polymerase-binding transcription factor DksA